MIQVVFINEYGEIKQWCSPGDDNMYIDGRTYNGLTAIHVPYDTDLAQFEKTNVYVEGAWTVREACPSLFHYWEGAWVFNSAAFEAELRRQRDNRLIACDWTQMPDAPLTEEQKQQWQLYRQKLRDLPEINEATRVEDILWPIRPV